MLFSQGAVGSASLVAFTPGFFIAVGFILAGLLAIYAIWWLIFRAGKEE